MLQCRIRRFPSLIKQALGARHWTCMAELSSCTTADGVILRADRKDAAMSYHALPFCSSTNKARHQALEVPERVELMHFDFII